MIGELHPIYLIGNLYRIVSKILAARLKKVMHMLISICQSTFIIKNKQMLDMVLMLNEIVDLAKRQMR